MPKFVCLGNVTFRKCALYKSKNIVRNNKLEKILLK